MNDATGPRLGVCYYPEHWPEHRWAEDAGRMVELGISVVRIGEFSWSRLEPSPGAYQLDWLQQAIDILHDVGLEIILGTPTATPPKWLVDLHPDMLPVDRNGVTRTFGSRRHYSFSHPGYLDHCRRIVTVLAKRFGNHPAVVAWQTDNEYGCHDTTHSYSPVDREQFRDWLAAKYQSPEALNRAWGNVFWSMEVNDFDQIELPSCTVTDANPAHWMDYCRFASKMVERFNRVQVDILRKYSPGRDIVHNFMGRMLDFDHFAVGKDLDVSAWDSYPLGFLEDRSDQPDSWKRTFANAGDPDFQAFHHDLYRATSPNRLWVMEQQPGPVNWAPHNPAPREGMVRLWTWEAFAHGAELVAYFRWRQAPFAQEQMHSGLLRPDYVLAEGGHEAATVAAELGSVKGGSASVAKIALLVDYPSAWAWQIQPQGAEFDYFRLVFDHYRCLRRLGYSLDIIDANSTDWSQYELILVPGLFSWNETLRAHMESFSGTVILGPRSGSKTENFAIPDALPPDLPDQWPGLKISRVESIRADSPIAVVEGGHFQFWREHAQVDDDTQIVERTKDGLPAIVRQDNRFYLCGWPDQEMLLRVIAAVGTEIGLLPRLLPDGVRLRQWGALEFAFNYGNTEFDLAQIFPTQACVLGDRLMKPSGVAAMALGDAGDD